MSIIKPKKQLILALLEREKAPETHLVKTIGFWASILPPLIIGITLIVIAGIEEEMTLDFSTSGYNHFLEKFKLPIGIMGLAIPLGALSAAIHRSIQTSRQILEQNSQNIFSNYLQHRKHFFEYIEENKPFKELNVDAAVLYEFFFRNASEGDLRPNAANIEAINSSFRNAISTTKVEYSTQLSERNLSPKSDITIETIASALNSARSLLGVQINKSPEALRLKSFRYVLHSCSVLKKVAYGIYKSANFHKQYISPYESLEIDQGLSEIENQLDKYTAIANISETIFQAFKNHGHSEHDDESQQNDNGLRQALSDISESFYKNDIPAEGLILAFKYQMNDREKRLLRNLSPPQWKVIFSSL